MPARTAIVVRGTLSIGDLARYQYHRFHRKGWPFPLVVVLLELLFREPHYYNLFAPR